MIHHCGLVCLGIAFLRGGWGGGFINSDCMLKVRTGKLQRSTIQIYL